MSLEEASGGQSPGHPLDRHHLAFFGDEGRVAGYFNERRLKSGLVQQLKDFRRCSRADCRLARERVRLHPVAGGDAILALQKTERRVVDELEDLLRFSLDYQLSSFVSCKRQEKLSFDCSVFSYITIRRRLLRSSSCPIDVTHREESSKVTVPNRRRKTRR